MTPYVVMTVTLDRVTAISRLVAAEHDRTLRVDGVTFSDGSSERVEVLVAIAGCHKGQCRFAVNVTRSDGEEFERELREKLSDALKRHRSLATSE